MHIRLTPAEILGLLTATGHATPPVITSVDASGETLRLVADLRRMDTLSGPLKLAVRFAPIIRATVQIVSFSDGVATVNVEANAAGLPAHKLLALAATPAEQALSRQGFPPGLIDVQHDGRVAVDVERLLEAKLPGVTVTSLRVADGEIVLDGSAS